MRKLKLATKSALVAVSLLAFGQPALADDEVSLYENDGYRCFHSVSGAGHAQPSEGLFAFSFMSAYAASRA